MGFITGMKAISQVTAPRDTEFAKRLKLEDGQSIIARIVGEMDVNSPNYSPDRGLCGVVREHKSPTNWQHKASCTLDELGHCWACEQAAATGDKAWRWKLRFYFNLLFTDAEGNKSVVYWDVATYRSPIYEAIKDQFLDTGSVSNVEWRLKRSGKTQNDTTYTFMPKGFDKEPFDWTGVKPYELSELVPTIPYEDQAAFYGAPLARPAATAAVEPAQDMEWL